MTMTMPTHTVTDSILIASGVQFTEDDARREVDIHAAAADRCITHLIRQWTDDGLNWYEFASAPIV